MGGRDQGSVVIIAQACVRKASFVTLIPYFNALSCAEPLYTRASVMEDILVVSIPLSLRSTPMYGSRASRSSVRLGTNCIPLQRVLAKSWCFE